MRARDLSAGAPQAAGPASCTPRLDTAAGAPLRPGVPWSVPVRACPAHPSNVVEVVYRIDDGLLRTAHARRTASDAQSQTFVADLPALAAAQRLDYRAELRRVRQLVATLPADGSWLSVTPAPLAPATPAGPDARGPRPFPAYDTAGTPRFKYGLDFLGALTVQLRAEVIGHTPQGYRINFFVVHGEAHGPRLNGRVLPEGGDWMCIRPDGVGEVDIRITYETPDGALLLEQSGGVFDIGTEAYADVLRGVYAGAPPFFATPVYVTAHPRWQWINALQCFGFGRVVMRELRVECDIYAPRLEGGPPVD